MDSAFFDHHPWRVVASGTDGTEYRYFSDARGAESSAAWHRKERRMEVEVSFVPQHPAVRESSNAA